MLATSHNFRNATAEEEDGTCKQTESVPNMAPDVTNTYNTR